MVQKVEVCAEKPIDEVLACVQSLDSVERKGVLDSTDVNTSHMHFSEMKFHNMWWTRTL